MQMFKQKTNNNNSEAKDPLLTSSIITSEQEFLLQKPCPVL